MILIEMVPMVAILFVHRGSAAHYYSCHFLNYIAGADRISSDYRARLRQLARSAGDIWFFLGIGMFGVMVGKKKRSDTTTRAPSNRRGERLQLLYKPSPNPRAALNNG